jgi:very-short-patch-repair endonuclease
VDNDGAEGLCDHLADFEVDWEKYVVEIGGSNHESETALDNHDFKHRIENNGSIEELIEKVRECLK